ncbi:unnamed protein product [Rotaria sordida]|uniref:MULE transposase domain-containing protein n=1 Tax=Rotaria sordida TaxID=392033 RepID=A0A815Q3Z7_9BILA|nr:unnamed protein product [Rotaria sordida]CAF4087689.1 unnamed protein product [Rotaria sordida]
MNGLWQQIMFATNCKAYVHTDLNNNFLKSSGEHHHLLESEDFHVKQFQNIVKDRIIKELAPISKIYDEILKAEFSIELLASVPLARDIQLALNRARRKLTPILPGSATFDIPDSYQITSNGENDFESSLISIIRAEFPHAEHQGCYFHYTQAIYRHIQDLGLSAAHLQDEEIRFFCRKLMAIVLLPIEEVKSSYYNLCATSSTRVKEELRQLLLYFDSHWINDVPLKLWNTHDYQYRTNNISEVIHILSFLNVAYDPYV